MSAIYGTADTKTFNLTTRLTQKPFLPNKHSKKTSKFGSMDWNLVTHWATKSTCKKFHQDSFIKIPSFG